MIAAIRAHLGDAFRLRIDHATWDDTTLTIAGPDWSLATESAWRLVSGGVLACGWSDPRARAVVSALVGLDVVRVEAQDERLRGDPALQLSSGEWLEVFSDHGLEPWVFALPGRTFVGSPADARYVDPSGRHDDDPT